MLLGSPQALAQTTQFSGQNWQIMEDGFGDELHFEGGTNGNGAFYIIDDATLGSTRVEANKYCDLGAANCVTAAQMANAVGSIIASLNDINDVVITGTPADNEVLAYDTSTSKWINQTATEAGIDGSTTNEIQTLSLSSNTLSLSVGGGSANLASYLDNTDTQDLSLSGTTLSLVGSPSVDLSGLSDGYAPASGSSGAVQFSAGSGVFSADANKLFWDNSTKQLGIGSSAPSEILEIEGAANLTGSDPVRIQVTNSTSGNWTADAEVMGLDFYSNDTSITSGQSAGRIALRTNVGSTDGANFAMAFSVHGSQALNEAMRIDKDAQVGLALPILLKNFT